MHQDLHKRFAAGTSLSTHMHIYTNTDYHSRHPGLDEEEREAVRQGVSTDL